MTAIPINNTYTLYQQRQTFSLQLLSRLYEHFYRTCILLFLCQIVLLLLRIRCMETNQHTLYNP